MHPYVQSLSRRLEDHRDPDRAVDQKRYMRGQFEFLGISATELKEATRLFLRDSGFPEEDEVEAVVHACWGMPEREYQYVAMMLSGRLAKKAPLCRVDLYEYMVRERSWWDTVDYIASNLIGVHFQRFEDAVVPYTDLWMNSGNIWLQRVCLLYQLKYKQKTDLRLLDQFISGLSGTREFFINKAIGWILREYSKTDGEWVREYVRLHKETLSPLSQREALKWLENQKLK